MLFLRYGVWQMSLLFFIWGYFLPFYPTNSPKNQNFKKMKTSLEIDQFKYVYQKLWWDNARLLRYGMRQTDGWTDGKSWVPHLEMTYNLIILNNTNNNRGNVEYLTIKIIIKKLNELIIYLYYSPKGVVYKQLFEKLDNSFNI